jgi:hypothetical protein
MLEYEGLPLRCQVRDAAVLLQADFIDQANLLLGAFAGVKTESSPRGLILRAAAERDLEAAVAFLRAAFPLLQAQPVEVVLLEGGSLEPVMRVRVATPHAYIEAVRAELVRRGAQCIEVREHENRGRLIETTARATRLLGLDAELARLTLGHAIAEYQFSSHEKLC